ncbi:MAG: hypothetical protein KBA44_09075, partial [Methanoculleus sp.]|nr:hypothetical protein [Methanoculleus sp.]
AHGYPHEGAGGVGAAGRNVWVSPRRRGRGGGRRQKRMGIPTKARVGRGGRQKCMGIPPKARAGWGMPAEVHG